MHTNMHTIDHLSLPRHKRMGGGKSIISIFVSAFSALLIASCSGDNVPLPDPEQSETSTTVTSTATTPPTSAPSVDYASLLTSHTWSVEHAYRREGNMVFDMTDEGVTCLFDADSVRFYSVGTIYDFNTGQTHTETSCVESFPYTLPSDTAIIGNTVLRLAQRDEGVVMTDDEWEVVLEEITK